jgi:pentatricopeptide repeat protein
MQYFLIFTLNMVWLTIAISLVRSRGKKGSFSAGRFDFVAMKGRHYSEGCTIKFGPRLLCSTATPSSGDISNGQKRPDNRRISYKDTYISKKKTDTNSTIDLNSNSTSPIASAPSFNNNTGNSTFSRVSKNQKKVESVDRERKPHTRKEKQRASPNEEFTEEFRHVSRTRDFTSAMALYASMKKNKFYPRENVLTGLLSICMRKEHLINALEIYADFFAAGFPPNESAYMSLIRCYSDDGQIDEALRLIEEMNDGKDETRPKLRTYHPILEAVCRNNDFDGAMLIIQQIKNASLVPRSEQLTLLLEVAVTSGSLNSVDKRKLMTSLLESASIDLLGIETQEIRRVVSAYCGSNMTEVLSEGILIESRKDLPGEILDSGDNPFAKNVSSIVTAMNSTYPNVPTLLTDTMSSPAVIDNTIPLGFDSWNNEGIK